jgi:hypothetical protein
MAYPTGSRLPCTLLASWDEGHAEPWLVLTDLAASAAGPAWYAWRMRIGQGFRAVKLGQWDWQRARMADADRAARLCAALAVATIMMVEVGGQGEPPDVPPVPRRLSLIREGLLRLFAALMSHGPVRAGCSRTNGRKHRGNPSP